MLRITKIEPEPFHTLGYRTAGPKGKPIHVQLPFHRAEAEGLPSSVQALVLTSDLQGRETGSQNRLLGCALADELVVLHNKGIIPRPNLIALCGDLYEYPDCHKRGGTGPVDEVFFALGGVCDQVVGVLGNHDELARRDTVHAPNISILDGTRDSVLGLRIGGLSGIIGDPKRHLRRSEDDFLKRLESLTSKSPNLLLLHQGPDDPELSRRGDPSVRLSLETGYAGLTVFGHTRWHGYPLITLGSGQVLNVDGRVIIVTPSDVESSPNR